MAGYSKRSLKDKLGLKPNASIYIGNSPENYHIMLELPHDLPIDRNLRQRYDFMHYFANSVEELQQIFSKLTSALDYKGMLWISWPKKGAKMKTDLNENIIREIGLANGLVDVKVCAVDDNWSALKFVYRLKDRK